jgi:hypothetical protein
MKSDKTQAKAAISSNDILAKKRGRWENPGFFRSRYKQ